MKKGTFEYALYFLKKGNKIRRTGWNGKGMYLKLISSGTYGLSNSHHNDIQEDITGFLPWIGMKTADDKFVPWLASQTDLLCEDWEVVE